MSSVNNWHEVAFSASMRGDSNGANYARAQESSARWQERIDRGRSAQDVDLSGVHDCVGGCVEALITGRSGTRNEVVIEASDMFAKTILRIKPPEELCQFLQNLDKEETEKQKTEEQEIQQKRLEKKAEINATATAVIGSAFGAVLIGAPLPFALIIPAVAGAIAGVISDFTDGFNNATTLAIKNLDLHRKRTVRLEDKVRKIAAAIEIQDQEQTSRRQLVRTEVAFSRIIEQYRAWEGTQHGNHT